MLRVRVDWSYCVVFLCKKLDSHGASFHPGVSKGTGGLLKQVRK